MHNQTIEILQFYLKSIHPQYWTVTESTMQGGSEGVTMSIYEFVPHFVSLGVLYI